MPVEAHVVEIEPLDLAERSDLAIAEDTIQAGLSSFIKVGEALAKIRDRHLYRYDYATFEDYCQERWGLSRAYAYRLVGAADVLDNLSPMGDILPENERQIRPLTRLEPEQQREAWSKAVETAPEGKVTAKHVETVVGEMLAQGENNDEPDDERNEEDDENEAPSMPIDPSYRGPVPTSLSNEWYTPELYIEAAREVLGGFDVDPASCEMANETVQAARYFTVEDDGLSRDWAGSVWLNPPYGTDEAGASNAGRWASMLIRQYREGITREAILCVNSLTHAPWFRQLWDFTVCLTDHRVCFDSPENDRQRPMNGTAFIYLGSNERKFAEVFSQFGAVVKRVEVA